VQLTPDTFASRIVGLAPLARAFVPKEIALDEKLIKSTAKEWKTLLAAEQRRRPKDDPGQSSRR
jgi:hypothetical protein